MWEYVFQEDGSVRWTDPFNTETGTGRWSLTPKTIYIAWSKSATKESWNRPVKRTDQSGWIEASYRTGAFSAEKMDALVLPGSAETDLELDPVTGEFVQSDPQTNSRYIERTFTAVAYGILPDGYYIYCQGMDLPILTPASLVDFSLAGADRERSKIFDTHAEARSAANDNAARRRIARIGNPTRHPGVSSTVVA